jgi:hypothetical protein
LSSQSFSFQTSSLNHCKSNIGGVFFVITIQKEKISLKSKSLNHNSKLFVDIFDCIKEEFANFLRCQLDLSSKA